MTDIAQARSLRALRPVSAEPATLNPFRLLPTALFRQTGPGSSAEGRAGLPLTVPD